MPQTSITSVLRMILGGSPSATAPMANSGWMGTPILRTSKRSSGASRAWAASAATGTPPRGSASTTGSRSLYLSSASASLRPASIRFWNSMAATSMFLDYRHERGRLLIRIKQLVVLTSDRARMLDRQNEYPLQDAENGAAALTRKVSFLASLIATSLHFGLKEAYRLPFPDRRPSSPPPE